MRLDLNCDCGESYNDRIIGNDEAIIPLVSSINLACGAHGGDPLTLTKAIRLAKAHHVAIGAHPSYPDLEGFGRRELALNPEQLILSLKEQMLYLQQMTHENGTELHHIKAHGALYNKAMYDQTTIRLFCQAIQAAGLHLSVVMMSASPMIPIVEAYGFPVIQEVFADRNYTADNQLVPRSQPNALISDPAEVSRRAVQLVKDGYIESIEGTRLMLKADTLCVHGDGTHALDDILAIRSAFKSERIELEQPLKNDRDR